MNCAAISGIEVEREGLTSVADLANPFLGFVGNAIGALALIIGYINIYACELGVTRGERHRHYVL
jgi:hypothetical protein